MFNSIIEKPTDMKLLPNEEVILTLSNEQLTLTNQRIHMNYAELGQAMTISIFLEKISSIETKYKSYLFLLIIAAIVFLGGIAGNEMTGAVVGGGIFFAIWWFTRKHVVTITSDGGSSLNYMIQGISTDNIHDFVHQVSAAKQNRTHQLFKIG